MKAARPTPRRKYPAPIPAPGDRSRGRRWRGGGSRRTWLGASLLAALFLVAAADHGLGAAAPPRLLPPDGSSHPPDDDDGTAGSGCAAGCAALPLPESGLSPLEFDALLEKAASQPLDGENLAFETLLFHGNESLRWLDRRGHGPLGADGEALLRAELSRTHVWVGMRVIDESGVVRASLPAARVPLGERRHIRMKSSERLELPEVSGTVRRVGLHHLWTRW